MIDPSVRPGGRRNASRRRRQPRRPSDHHDRSVAGNGDTPQSFGNLTTINLLPPVEAPTGFADLGVPERVDEGLSAPASPRRSRSRRRPSPSRSTGRDVCGRARTGSGKTLVLGVPMLARLEEGTEPRRAARAGAGADPRARASRRPTSSVPVAQATGRNVLAVYGGASRQQQIDERPGHRRHRRDTVAADRPPEAENEIDLADVKIVVLDEADRMADDGFTPQVEWILRTVHGAGRRCCSR